MIVAIAAIVFADPPAFTNIVAANGADPWVFQHADGYYYSTLTTSRNIALWRSKALSGAFAGEPKIVWTPPKVMYRPVPRSVRS